MAAAVALVAVVASLPAVGNGYVAWDDDKNVLENFEFRGLGPAQVAWAWGTYLMGVYQPLGWMLMEAEYALWGLDPRGYHATSVLLHAAVAVALYAVTVALLARALPDADRRDRGLVPVMAGLAVALFAAHPLRTEVVAWVSCQSYLPCALGALLAVLAYLRACEGAPARPARPGWLAVAFGLFVAALLCKAVAVGVPAVLVILDVYPLRRLGPGRWAGRSARRAWLEKVPFVAASLLFMVIAIRARAHFRALVGVEYDSLAARVARIGHTLAFYPAKTAWPADLIAEYPIPAPDDPAIAPAAVLVAGATVGLVLLRRRYPGALAAWASYLAILAPHAGLVRIGRSVTADRYSYVASMGGVVLLAAGLCRLCASPAGRRRRPAVVAVGVGLTLALAALSWRQCRAWADTEALWVHALAHGGDRSADVHDNLGIALAGAGRAREAIEQYEAALRLDPDHFDAHNNLGAAFRGQGKLAEAEAQFAEALRIEPNHAEARNNLGMALAARGAQDRAIAELEEAARLRPDIPVIRFNLGCNLARAGRTEEAIGHLAEAVRLRPDAAGAHEQLGLAFAQRGRFAEAAAELSEALRLGIDTPELRNNLGSTLVELGRLDEARDQFAAALRLRPGYAEAHHGLGTALARQGRRAEAAAQFAEALRLDPRHAQARRDLDALRP